MFRSILYTQWKWARIALIAIAVAAVAVPVGSVRAIGGVVVSTNVGEALNTMRVWSVLYVALAALAGLVLAISAWAADQRGHHVYALSLPVPRWHYVLLRFVAGLTLLLVPALLVWLGGLVASAIVVLPAGLTTYPGALALRWMLAAFVAYALFFAISSGTARTAGLVLGVIAGLVAADMMLALMDQQAVVLEFVFSKLFEWPGVFEVFTGRWMLIDV